MAEVKFDQKSLKVIVKIKDLKRISEKGMRQAWFKIGKDLVKTANGRILAKDKKGRLYGIIIRNGKKRLTSVRAGLKTHRASAPGQSPANLNGDLRRSLKTKIRGSSMLEFSANTDYARGLELGTSSAKPRPYMFPSVVDNRRNIERHFAEEIKKGIKRAG